MSSKALDVRDSSIGAWLDSQVRIQSPFVRLCLQSTLLLRRICNVPDFYLAGCSCTNHKHFIMRCNTRNMHMHPK